MNTYSEKNDDLLRDEKRLNAASGPGPIPQNKVKNVPLPNSRNWRFGATFMAVSMFSPLVLTGCDQNVQADARTNAPLVRIAAVQVADSESRVFTGTVSARVESDLGFRVSGKVLDRLVDTGQSVKRGQPLMRLDPVDMRLAAQAAEESVMAAKALAKQASEDEVRYRNLLGTGAIAASTYDQKKAASDAAKAQLSAAVAQAEVARNATRYTELVADADGVVVETLAEPGQVVSAGQAVVRLAHDGQREAIIQLPETLRPEVGSTGQASLYGLEGVSVEATLRQLSDSADQLSRTFEGRYVLTGELANAPLGTTVTVQIPTHGDSSQTIFQVPIAGLLDSGNGPGVWVVEDKPTQVTWRPVSVQSLSDDVARIEGDFNINDRVIALGAHLLHEGQQVRLTNEHNPVIAENEQ